MAWRSKVEALCECRTWLVVACTFLPLWAAFLSLQDSPVSEGPGPLCSASSQVRKCGYWSQFFQEATVTLGRSNASSLPSLCANGVIGVEGDVYGLQHLQTAPQLGCCDLECYHPILWPNIKPNYIVMSETLLDCPKGAQNPLGSSNRPALHWALIQHHHR